MTWDKGFNFRATSGYVTDQGVESPVLGTETYPHSFANGATAGWDADISGNSRDRDNTNDRRLAGVNADDNTGTQHTFRIDLPATGQYSVRLALGDTSFQAYMYLQIRDGATPLLTIDDTNGNNPSGLLWDDATGTSYDNATWPGSNTPVTLTFTGTVLNLVLGSPSAQANSSPIAHLFISQVAGGAVIAWFRA